ncbi:MAG: hypothetical protein AAGF01_18855, partial [Cyanobacteria bacterium P01_G01_bin.38]
MRENTRTWRWLASGSLGAVGLWFGLFWLPERTPPPPDITTLDRIELIVTNIEEPLPDTPLPEALTTLADTPTPANTSAAIQSLPQTDGLTSSDLDAGAADAAVPAADKLTSAGAPDETLTPDDSTPTSEEPAVSDSLEDSEDSSRVDQTSPLPADSDNMQPDAESS